MSTAAPKPEAKPKPAVNPNDIAYCKIHPGLGIARMGDSREEFFIGPEAPGHMPNPHGGFKDKHGRVKRQAARFRIYAYNAAGEAIAELTAADADIQWSVQVANKKASYNMFLGRYWDIQFPDVKKYADEHNNGNPPVRMGEPHEVADRYGTTVFSPSRIFNPAISEHFAIGLFEVVCRVP